MTEMPSLLQKWVELFLAQNPVRLAPFGSLLPSYLAGESPSPQVIADQIIPNIKGRAAWPQPSIDDVDRFLEAGDILAAEQTLEKLGTEASATREEQVRQRKVALHHDLEALKQDVRSSLSELRKLNLSERNIQSLNDDMDRAGKLAQHGRLGQGLEYQRRVKQNVDNFVEQALNKVRQDAAHVEREVLSALDPERRERVLARLRLAREYVNHMEIRLGDEEVRHARRVLEGGNDNREWPRKLTLLDADQPLPPQMNSQFLTDFLAAPQKALNMLPATARQEVEARLPSEWVGKKVLPVEDRVEAMRALRAARERRPNKASNNEWKKLLDSLFTTMSSKTLQPSFNLEPLEVRSHRDEIASGFFLVTAHPAWHVPGSFLNPVLLPDGLPIVLWFKPNEILKPVHLSHSKNKDRFLAQKPFAVIAADRIPESLRKQFADEFHTAAIFDEMDVLRVLLSRHPEDTFVRHFGTAEQVRNPYQPSGFVTGAMFFGRRSELTRMTDPRGPYILHGGRKLGKSSLLREVQRQFEAENPGRNVAVCLEVKNAGTVSGSAGEVLRRILTELRHPSRSWAPWAPESRSPFEKLAPTTDPTEFERQIRELVAQHSKHRFLILLDEADQFLRYLNVPQATAAEQASGNFERQIGWSLRSLANDLVGRFDVRFAGFQDIDRVGRDSSGPFFNFRPSEESHLALQVLSEKEARELVERPMNLLGIGFERSSLVDRILDYSGRHPALIQRFCKELVDLVVRPSTGFLSKRVVTSANVERVFEKNDFRDQLVELIRLNVEGESITKRSLKLVLLIWVKMLNSQTTQLDPSGSPRLPKEIFSANEVHQFIVRTFGMDVSALLSVADVDLYLRDLSTLGVVNDEGANRYSLANRYFAELLQDPRYKTDLDKEAWESCLSLMDDQPENRRLRLHDDGLKRFTVFPMSQTSQERLLERLLPSKLASLQSPRSRLAVLVGHTRSGRSQVAQWLCRTMRLQGSNRTLQFEYGELAPDTTRLDLAALQKAWPGLKLRSWSDLAPSKSQSRCLVLERCDLGEDGLISWPADSTEIDDGPLQRLARLSAEHEMPVFLTGGYVLARTLVEWRDVLGEQVLLTGVEPLRRNELSHWLDTANLVPMRLGDELWKMTQGDLRVLHTLQEVVGRPQEDHDLSVDDLRQLSQRLEDPAKRGGTVVDLALKGYPTDVLWQLQETYKVLNVLGAPTELGELASLLADEMSNRKQQPADPWSWRVFLHAALAVGDLTLASVSEDERGQLNNPSRAKLMVWGPMEGIWGRLILSWSPQV